MDTAAASRTGRTLIHRVWEGDTIVSMTCSACGEHKPSDAFGNLGSGVGGKRHRCKACVSEYQRQWAERNRESERRRGREKYVRYQVEFSERQKVYRKENAQQIQEYKAAYRALNKARLKDYFSEYKRSPEGASRRLSNNHKRRAIKRLADCGCVTAAEMQAIWGVGACAYCDSPAEHYDHEVPLALGGLHCVSNLRPACAECNTKKGAKPLGDFLLYMEGLAHAPQLPARPCPNDNRIKEQKR